LRGGVGAWHAMLFMRRLLAFRHAKCVAPNPFYVAAKDTTRQRHMGCGKVAINGTKKKKEHQPNNKRRLRHEEGGWRMAKKNKQTFFTEAVTEMSTKRWVASLTVGW